MKKLLSFLLYIFIFFNSTTHTMQESADVPNEDSEQTETVTVSDLEELDVESEEQDNVLFEPTQLKEIFLHRIMELREQGNAESQETLQQFASILFYVELLFENINAGINNILLGNIINPIKFKNLNESIYNLLGLLKHDDCSLFDNKISCL